MHINVTYKHKGPTQKLFLGIFLSLWCVLRIPSILAFLCPFIKGSDVWVVILWAAILLSSEAQFPPGSRFAYGRDEYHTQKCIRYNCRKGLFLYSHDNFFELCSIEIQGVSLKNSFISFAYSSEIVISIICCYVPWLTFKVYTKLYPRYKTSSQVTFYGIQYWSKT